jgi:hypothetical protein
MGTDRVSHGLARAKEIWMVAMVENISSLPAGKAASGEGAEAS